jgi:hypothetical protein
MQPLPADAEKTVFSVFENLNIAVKEPCLFY